MTVLTFIRHAQSEANVKSHLINGRCSYAQITHKGIEQSRLLGKRLRDENINFDIVYSSPAVRTQQTLRYAMEEANRNVYQPEIDLRIQEMCQGDWEKVPREKIYTQERIEEIIKDNWNFVPGFQIKGESPKMVTDRMIDFLEDVSKKHEGKHIGIFGHGLAIRFMYAQIFGFDKKTAYKLPMENTAISQIEVDSNGNYHNRRFNSHEHLKMHLPNVIHL